MLPGYAVTGMQGGAKFAARHVYSNWDAVDRSSYTFGSVPIGSPPPGGKRYVVVTVSGKRTATISVTAVSVGGISAALIVQQNTQNSCAAIFIVEPPASSSVDVAINLSATAQAAVLSVYVLDYAQSAAAYDTISTNGTNPSSSIDCPAGGIVIAASSTTNGGPQTAWTGLANETIDVDMAINASGAHAHEIFTTPQVARPIGVTGSGNGSGMNLVAASFG